MKSDLFTIIKKEFARFFGDKRMLAAVVMPGILIYVMYTFMGSSMTEMYMPDENYICDIHMVNMPESMAFLENVEGLEIFEINASEINVVKEAIEEDETDLLVVFPEKFDMEMMTYDVMTATDAAPNVEIYYNSASVESSQAYSMMTGIFV